MDEKELVNRLYSFLFYGCAVLLGLLSLVTGNYIVIPFSCICLLFSGICMNSGHLINNLLIKHSKIIEKNNGYSLNPNLCSMTLKEGSTYRGISIARLSFEGTAKSDQSSLKALIESIQEPFTFSITMARADKKRMLDILDNKRRMKEIEVTKVRPDKQDKINGLRREAMALETEMESIRSSGKAFEISLILKAMGSAPTATEAARISAKSLERICDAFAATTKLNYEILKGEVLLSCAGVIYG